ncbi:eukaryotic translation initiation factor 5-like, partial [Arachis ipaensis]|uniref:eukaryotic translation initiation factor 5-like n=1 Tax=Arachis ipaensis TaxID=130454 RepID=UPI000A2B723A
YALICKGSENGDTVNYATVVREVKAYLKKGVAAKELQSHIVAFPVSAQEKMNALVEGLFDGVQKAFGKEATKRKNHLAGAVAGDDEGSQLLLLNAAEEFCYKKGSNELNEVALILKALYDVDLVEEEHVVHWYSKGLKGDKKDSQIWKNAQPFIDWIRNAESELEEE